MTTTLQHHSETIQKGTHFALVTADGIRHIFAESQIVQASLVKHLIGGKLFRVIQLDGKRSEIPMSALHYDVAQRLISTPPKQPAS